MGKIFKTIALVLILSSCSEDFINLVNPSQLSVEGYYKTQQDIEKAIFGIYDGLKPLYDPIYNIFEIRSDNSRFDPMGMGGTRDRALDEFYQVMSSSAQDYTALWDLSYNVILRANTVIEKANDATYSDPKLLPQHIADAKFLRALVYMHLNKFFGGYSADGKLLGVPLVDKVISQTESYNYTRATLEEVYNFIIADLKYAKENLPPNNGKPIVKGQATSGAAQALLGKIYMLMAGYPLNKGKEFYTLAANEFKPVIGIGASSPYSLVPNYKDLWDPLKKNSVESIIEIQFKSGSPGRPSSWSNSCLPLLYINAIGQQGSGLMTPTDFFSKAYEAGDPRKYVSMRDFVIDLSSPKKDTLWRKNCFKYNDPYATSTSGNSNNWIELRLADIYLMYSEALVRSNGDKSEALLYLNKVRMRARQSSQTDPKLIANPPKNILPDYTLANLSNDNDFLLALEQERRVELAFENHRWIDLVRTGRAKEIMVLEQKFDGYQNFVWSDDCMAAPIPETAMRSNPGKIIQNKGYSQL
jgi:hypothetical protein